MAVQSNLRLPSYEYLPIDWWGGTAAQSYGLAVRANLKKKLVGCAHLRERGNKTMYRLGVGFLILAFQF
jgi:hypothetical protein